MRDLHLLLDGDDLALVTLKGHLIVEGVLFAVVAESLPGPIYLEKARLTFFQLMHVARGMHCSPLVRDDIWDLMGELNALRNALAHNLEPKGITPKVAGLWDFVVRGLDDSETDEGGLDDTETDLEGADEFQLAKPESEAEVVRYAVHVILAGLAMISTTKAILANVKGLVPSFTPE